MNKGIDMYTFDEQTLSDLHKDARGFRPRSETFWNAWNVSDNDGKQTIWDGLCKELDNAMAEEARHDAEAVIDFQTKVEQIIVIGAGDRETALRGMTEGETFYHHQCVEHWVYNQGLLFTDLGNELVDELMDIVTFKEYV